MKNEYRLEGEAGLDVNEEHYAYVYPNTEVRIEKAQYSILHIRYLCEVRGEFILSRNFQGETLWSTSQISELIESILLGVPIPLIYLFESKDGSKRVVDGQQRITTILNFLNNKFSLCDLKILSSLNGYKFSDLEPKQQGVFEDFQLLFYIIQPPTPERIKYEILDRVNRGGTQLNNQEIRSALYEGKATVLIDEICKSDAFGNATDKTVSPERMQDRYIVLRAIAFYHLFSGKLLEADFGHPIEYRNDIDEFLAKVTVYLNKQDDAVLAEFYYSFLKALIDIYQILGENAFRFKSNDDKPRPVSMPLFESLVYLFLFEWDKSDKELIRSRIEALKERIDQSGVFGEAIDSAPCVRYRFDAMDDLLLELS